MVHGPPERAYATVSKQERWTKDHGLWTDKATKDQGQKDAATRKRLPLSPELTGHRDLTYRRVPQPLT
jgi:hypothetical protein